MLIKAVLQSIPSYSMTIFKLPDYFCKKLNSKMAKFWWSDGKHEKKIHWVRWSHMASSKAKGGFGFRDLSMVNESILAKQAWRLSADSQSLWAKVLKSIYFHDSTIWKANKGRNSSWSWKSILVGRDLLLKFIRWQIGNGSKVNIWDDAWLPNLNKIPNYHDRTETLVRDLLSFNGSSWNHELILSSFPTDIAHKILCIPLSLNQIEDRVIWPHNTTGSFTVKSGYHCLRGVSISPPSSTGSSSHLPALDLWKRLWKAKATPKVLHFVWKACHNILPTKESLFKRKCAPYPNCPICEQGPETVEHLLLLCPWTRPVWFGSHLNLSPSSSPITTFDSWLHNTMNHLNQHPNSWEEATSTLLYLCWYIWKSRNEWTFEHVQVNPVITIAKAAQASTEFLLADIKKKVGRVPPHAAHRTTPRWTAPYSPKVKINCDIAYNSKTSMAFTGVVARNGRGSIIDGISTKVQCESVLQGEALALRDGSCLFRERLSSSY